jgi:type IV conjugative transfer system pilin TraA
MNPKNVRGNARLCDLDHGFFFFEKMYTYRALRLFTSNDISLTQIEVFFMKVVSNHPAMAGGAAEACPPSREEVPAGFSGLFLRFFRAIYRHRANVILIALAVLFFALPHLGYAEDLLVSQKQDAKDTFGHGSTVEWGLYIAEILISGGLYMKTRNPMLFIGGLGFLIVVTRAFFALAG